MSYNLSRRQFEVLQAIRRLADDRHYMPSVRELGAVLNLSPATTQQHLTALRRKGYLTSDGTAHGLRLLREEGEDEMLELEETPPQALVIVPVIGAIAAGRPLEPVEEVELRLELGSNLARPGDYLLHVQGDSMVGDGILDGDLVLIRPQTTVENGQVAVAVLEDGTATLKRVYREDGRIRLQPANPTMAPIYLDHVEIRGRVVALVRNYK